MKHKLWTVFLTALVALCLVVGFAACDNGMGDVADDPIVTPTPDDEDPAAHEHTYAETWTSDDTYHWHASTCGHTDEVSGRGEHDYGAWEAERAATCTADGLQVRVCQTCGHEETQTLSMLGHDIVYHAGQAATCTQAGWEAYETCTRCDYTTYVTIPELGHDIIEHAGQAATCTQEGWEAYETCSRCDYTTYVTIPELGHDIVYHAGQTATCMQAGWEAYETCSRCDYTTYMAIPAAGHRLVPHAGQAATCTQSGWVTYETCENCDYTTYAAISELGHLYVNGVCDRCGVAEQVESITLDQDEIVLGIGGSTSIRATTDPATATVVWESSDDSVVTVTAFGKSVTVQAIGAGIAIVTAKAGTQEATCTVLVQPTESALCPDFTVQVYDTATGELTEETYSPADSLGQVTVIYFWGTWCDPCKAELPYFDRVASEDPDIVIVTVHSINSMEEAPEYISTNYANSNMVFTQDSLQTVDGNEYNVFALLGGINSYPRTIILDSEGVITFASTGSLYYEELVAEIEKAKDA